MSQLPKVRYIYAYRELSISFCAFTRTIDIVHFAAMMIVTPTEQKMTIAFFLMPH